MKRRNQGEKQPRGAAALHFALSEAPFCHINSAFLALPPYADFKDTQFALSFSQGPLKTASFWIVLACFLRSAVAVAGNYGPREKEGKNHGHILGECSDLARSWGVGYEALSVLSLLARYLKLATLVLVSLPQLPLFCTFSSWGSRSLSLENSASCSRAELEASVKG